MRKPIILENVLNIPVYNGGNAGHRFEITTGEEIYDYYNIFNNRENPQLKHIAKLLELMNKSNRKFNNEIIKEVHFRTGSTQKFNTTLAESGKIIGDIVLTDRSNQKWYISLKNENGNTFSTYPGISGLFSGSTLNTSSFGAEFLRTFGVDLNILQYEFDIISNTKQKRKHYKVEPVKPNKLKNLFMYAWGMNYFYAKQKNRTDWNVKWMGSSQLNELTSNMTVTDIKYPTSTSKQLTIYCQNPNMSYIVEVRNTSGGLYPNKAQFKTRYK